MLDTWGKQLFLSELPHIGTTTAKERLDRNSSRLQKQIRKGRKDMPGVHRKDTGQDKQKST